MPAGIAPSPTPCWIAVRTRDSVASTGRASAARRCPARAARRGSGRRRRRCPPGRACGSCRSWSGRAAVPPRRRRRPSPAGGAVGAVLVEGPEGDHDHEQQRQQAERDEDALVHCRVGRRSRGDALGADTTRWRGADQASERPARPGPLAVPRHIRARAHSPQRGRGLQIRRPWLIRFMCSS